MNRALDARLRLEARRPARTGRRVAVIHARDHADRDEQLAALRARGVLTERDGVLSVIGVAPVPVHITEAFG